MRVCWQCRRLFHQCGRRDRSGRHMAARAHVQCRRPDPRPLCVFSAEDGALDPGPQPRYRLTLCPRPQLHQPDFSRSRATGNDVSQSNYRWVRRVFPAATRWRVLLPLLCVILAALLRWVAFPHLLSPGIDTDEPAYLSDGLLMIEGVPLGRRFRHPGRSPGSSPFMRASARSSHGFLTMLILGSSPVCCGR